MGIEETIARRHLGNDRLKRVKVVHEVNADGEKIARIFVVYESSKGHLSVDEMSSITDEIWSVSLEKGGASFPVPSFVSSDDEERALSPA
jgi:hypothetical protein